MAYVAWSVVFNEQPSTAKWNILGTNDASFNDGTGIASSAILSKHIAPTVYASTATAQATAISNSWGDCLTQSVTMAAAGKVLVWGSAAFRHTSGALALYTKGRINVDGTTGSESRTDCWVSTSVVPVEPNYYGTHAAGTFNVKFQGISQGGAFQTDSCQMIIMILAA